MPGRAKKVDNDLSYKVEVYDTRREASLDYEKAQRKLDK
jgi:hypothetical protein